MNVTEAFTLSNVAPGTYALPAAGLGQGHVNGGKYALITKSTGTGTIDLLTLSADGTTYVKVATQITATTGFQVLDLPPGVYEVIIATFTANYIALARIPY